MTTPTGPKPPNNHTLTPTNLGVKQFGPSRVYPDKPNPGSPDVYGQVGTADKDRSRESPTSPDQSALAHYRSDIDSSPMALHHSLGSGRQQASPGDHTHDGGTSVRIGDLEFDPTPGNEGKLRPAWTCAADATSIRTLLHKFIEFRDI